MKTVCANARLQVISVILCCVGLQQIAQAQQFAPAVNYPTGINPVGIAVGDFNQDGIPDLVVANSGSDTVSILLGNRDGTFRPSREYSAGDAGTESVVVGDFNGDGKLDLMVANVGDHQQSGNVGVLLGNGDGTFMPVVVYDAGAAPGFVAVGDFNGDGKLDFAASGNLANVDLVSIFLGKGDGTFVPAVNYPTGVNGPQSVVVADLNGNGRLDLVVTNPNSDSISVLLGRGDGTFQAAGNYLDVDGPFGTASGDFNGDGKLDLVVANAEAGGTVSVLIGNGDGTFQAPVSYRTGGYPPWSVAVGDFNSDGKLDLIVTGSLGGFVNTVSLLLGNGDGTFQAPVPYIVGADPLSVAVADLNSDGLLDVAVANAHSDNVSVLLNVGRPPVSQRLAALLTEVTGVGPGKSLADKVALAQTYYAAKDVQATCAELTGFVNEVKAQAGKKIAHTLDAKLIADANAIETAVDCN
jgi:hypothetical protein